MADEPLNILSTVAAPVPIQRSEIVAPIILVMIDIESLALGTRPVITQIAMLGYNLEEDEHLPIQHVQFYPIDPQQELIPARRISGQTLAWWMKQSDEARARFEQSTDTDFQSLPAMLRNLIMVFNQMTKSGTIPYEVCAKGPQFDIAAIETLIQECGLEIPWDHNKVRDLRTLLAVAGLSESDVPKPAGMIPHVAYWDSRWQIESYLAAKRLIRHG